MANYYNICKQKQNKKDNFVFERNYPFIFYLKSGKHVESMFMHEMNLAEFNTEFCNLQIRNHMWLFRPLKSDSLQLNTHNTNLSSNYI